MIKTDAIIIGAGPVGLFQVFELGLQGIQCHVIEAMAEPGGQCSVLYPHKPIYDIPAVPVCSGQELIDNLMRQIDPFNAQFHYQQQVAELYLTEDGEYRVTTDDGLVFLTKAIIIASGAGAFTPIKLRVDGLEQFLDRQLFYRVNNVSQHVDKNIVVVGGGDAAFDWTLSLYQRAHSVTLVHRSLDFKASPHTVQQVMDLVRQGRINFICGRIRNFVEQDGVLQKLEIHEKAATPQLRLIDVDQLLVFFGLSPKLGAVAEWGIDSERNLIKVDTARFESSLAGIYAIGDINQYPGKRKLILSGFHEAALVAFAVKQRLEPDKKHHLQYTTTSSLMLQRLGVA